jgi:hypothetical protein
VVSRFCFLSFFLPFFLVLFHLLFFVKSWIWISACSDLEVTN